MVRLAVEVTSLQRHTLTQTINGQSRSSWHLTPCMLRAKSLPKTQAGPLSRRRPAVASSSLLFLQRLQLPSQRSDAAAPNIGHQEEQRGECQGIFWLQPKRSEQSNENRIPGAESGE